MLHERRRRRASTAGGLAGQVPCTTASRRGRSVTLRPSTAGVVNYTGGAFPEQLRSGRVSADFFKLFGAPVLHGRTFTADEDLPGRRQGRRRSAIRLWTRRFDSDPDIVGKTISLSGNPYDDHRCPRIRAFDFQELGAATPRSGSRSSSIPTRRIRGTTSSIAGRLAPGVTLEQAQRAAEALVRRVHGRSSRTALGPEHRASSVAAAARSARQERPLVAARARRRRQLRAAHRLRERRQPAARPRDGAAA